MSFSFLSLPIYITMVTIAGISLIYAAISRHNEDSKILRLTYFAFGINCFVATYTKITKVYNYNNSEAIFKSEKIMYFLLGVGALCIIAESIRQSIKYSEKRILFLVIILAIIVVGILLFLV